MSAILRCGLLALLAVTACSGDAFVTSRSEVDEANELLAEGQHEEALEAYEALDTKNLRIAFNRGLALFHLKRWDEAVAAFEEATGAGAGDESMMAAAYYHIGNVHAARAVDIEESATVEEALPVWKEAVKAYENALLVDADHGRAKHQLEIALYKVDPPCHLRNDEYEPNNSFELAKPIELEPWEDEEAAPAETRAERELRICPDDEDWFRVSLAPGDRLFAESEVTETAEAGKKNQSPQQPRQLGALEIWSPDGATRLQPPKSSLKSLSKVSVTEDTLQGDYRVRLANPLGDDFSAKLTLRVQPACQATEDAHEPNDTLAQARDITPLLKQAPQQAAPGQPPAPGGAEQAPVAGPMRLCPNQEDWFSKELAAGESLRVSLEHKTQAGTLNFKLTDATGKVLAEGKAKQKALEAVAYNPGAGRVYMQIGGTVDVEAVYALKLEVIPPCAQREDDKEPNDTMETAAALPPGDYEKLQLCPGNDDWFQVDVEPHQSVVAHVSGEVLHGKFGIEIMDSQKKVRGRGVPLEGGAIAMALDLQTGTYSVRVFGADSTYDLKLQVVPECPEGNDIEEKNDSAEEAKLLEAMPPPGQPQQPPPPGQQQAKPPKPKLLRICPGDEDWFFAAVTPETPLMAAQVQFVHEKGDLNVALYDSRGVKRLGESDRSSTEMNGEAVVIPPADMKIPAPTEMKLRIRGADEKTQNFYLLSLRQLPPSGKDGQSGGQGDQDKNQQQPQNQNQQQQPEQRPDRSAFEKKMERDDKNERNLEAEAAGRKIRHEPPALKDW